MKKIFGLILLCATMVGFASCNSKKSSITLMRIKMKHLGKRLMRCMIYTC